MYHFCAKVQIPIQCAVCSVPLCSVLSKVCIVQYINNDFAEYIMKFLCRWGFQIALRAPPLLNVNYFLGLCVFYIILYILNATFWHLALGLLCVFVPVLEIYLFCYLRLVSKRCFLLYLFDVTLIDSLGWAGRILTGWGCGRVWTDESVERAEIGSFGGSEIWVEQCEA